MFQHGSFALELSSEVGLFWSQNSMFPEITMTQAFNKNTFRETENVEHITVSDFVNIYSS